MKLNASDTPRCTYMDGKSTGEVTYIDMSVKVILTSVISRQCVEGAR